MSPVKTLSVFFPCYNEEDNIVNTVSQAIKVLQSLKLADYEVIVVDDGSTDNTAAVVQNLADKNPKIRLVSHGHNRGYGAALKTGFSSAKFDWIAFTDSDGQFDFEEIKKFIASVDGHRVVVGYRKKRSDSKFRRTMAFLLRIWDTVLFGLDLKDVDCGFKLIKKSVIDKIFPLVTESAITETEMMAKIHRAGFPIKQIGVAHHSREGGVQTGGNFRVIFKAVIESLKLFLHFRDFRSRHCEERDPSLKLGTGSAIPTRLPRPFGARNDVVILLAILLTAAWLRLFRLRDYLVFLGDEGRDMLVWFNMVYRGEFTFLGPTASVGGFYLGPIYYYLALPFYYFIRDPVGPAVFIAITGILTVWLIHRVCLKWFGKTAGLFAGASYAAAALIIRYSRASWNPNPVPFFTLLGIYLAASGPSKFRYLKIIAAGICLGILWQLHYLTLILTPIFITIVIQRGVSWHTPGDSSSRSLALLLTPFSLLLLGWTIGFSPFLAFEIYHNFPNTKTVIEYATRPGGGVLNFELLGLVRSVIRNTARLYQTVLTWSDNPLTHLVAYTTVIAATLISLKKKSFAILIWFYLGIIIFSLYQGSISDYYFGFLFPIPFIFAAASAQYLWDKFSAAKALVFLLAALLILDQSNRWFLKHSPNRLLNQTEAVAQKVIDLSDNRPYNFALITGGNSDHAYRYFLEIHQTPPTPLSSQITDQLIAVCEKPQQECQPLGNPIWEIAGFGRAEIDTQDTVPPGITVYRLTHYNEIQPSF